MTVTRSRIGEPVPWFEAASPINPRFQFETVAGRYSVLCFFGSTAAASTRRVLDDVLQHRSMFNDRDVSFFGISFDPEDERRAREVLPGIHLFWDFDGKIHRLFGARVQPGAEAARPAQFSLVLDERLRIFAILPFGEEPELHVERLLQALSALPPLQPEEPSTSAPVPAPVLIVPRILEPELCGLLIRHYEECGGEESGFMRDIGGKTVGMFDHRHKRRKDVLIKDERLRRACMARLHNRLVPEIRKAFQFHATRIERYLVACYESETGGHFRAHRDNTTKGTAHRQFAVSLVLNAGEFEGGQLRFPEFGRQTYCPPAGGAVVFSCSLLHEATLVTRGKRYAFLPFLYDEAAARIRDENRGFVAADGASSTPWQPHSGAIPTASR